MSNAPQGKGYKAVSVSGLHACALSRTGVIECWGDDRWAQVSGTPTGKGFRSVSAGDVASCALDKSGAVTCWGGLGLESRGMRLDRRRGGAEGSLDPLLKAPTGKGYRAVSVGAGHACAMTASGEIECWGPQDYGWAKSPQVFWPKGMDCNGYRLPTQAEWEIAARAGGSTAYPGSDDVCSVSNVPNSSRKAAYRTMDERVYESAKCDDGYTGLAPVGSLQPNQWGFHDMGGNVAEWTWTDRPFLHDAYEMSAKRSPRCESAVEPWSETEPALWISRGGSWKWQPRAARVSANEAKWESPTAQTAQVNWLGFRLARTAP